MILYFQAMYAQPLLRWLRTEMYCIKSVEFEIDREYVGRVVGSQGSGVNRLREILGVKIDFSDDSDDTKDAGKKRKGAAPKSKITVRKSLPGAKKKKLIHRGRLSVARKTSRRPSVASFLR